MKARLVLGFVAIGSLVLTCAEPPPAKKATAAACDPSQTDCPAASGARPPTKDGTLKTTIGTPLESPDKKPKPVDPKAGEDESPNTEPTEETTTPTTPVPVPAERPEEELGPSCTKLKTCCENLRQAGITGSARQCDDTVAGKEELTCDIQNENYKTADDFYDPVCF